MKNVERVQIKYKDNDLGDALFDVIKNAEEEDLRVLLAAILTADGDEVETAKICEGLEISESEFFASLKYFKGAGLVSVPKKSRKKSEPAVTDEKPKIESAHKDGKIIKQTLPTYTSEELAALMKKRKITAAFIGEASRVYGKMFNQHEVEMIVRMIDYVGFDEESVLLLLSYYQKQKKSLRYIEKVAIEFYDEGISNAAELEAKLIAIDRYNSVEGKIRTIFGMNDRTLTTKEKKYVKAWVENMGFDIDMIRLAYDKTVDATQKPSVAYANAILERWFADGINTPEKVAESYEKRDEDKGIKVEKSFDTNDFFEAALKRSYGENN
jgi:DnaD/phage-associated family protein